MCKLKVLLIENKHFNRHYYIIWFADFGLKIDLPHYPLIFPTQFPYKEVLPDTEVNSFI